MRETRHNPMIRLLPSLTDVVFLLPIVFLFGRLSGTRTLLGDGDTGWHIRTGEWILDHARVPASDPFSFTKAGEPWFAWEWLWDVTAAWLYRHGGMALVLLASTLILSLSFALLFKLVQRHCPNLFIAAGVTVLATITSSIHWLARPHLVSFLLLVVFCWILERAAARKRWLWLLPVLTVAWVNFHGGFFVGVLLVLCYATGEAAAWLSSSEPGAHKNAFLNAKPYFLAALACLGASLINPYTYHLHAHIWSYLTDSYQLGLIDEFQSPNSQAASSRFFELMAALGLAAAGWHLLRRRWTYVFLLGGFVHMALLSVRNIPLFAIVAAPLIAWAAQEALESLRNAPVAAWVKRVLAGFEEVSSELAPMDRMPRWHAASAIGLASVAALLYSPAPAAQFRADYDPQRYPASALSVLESGGSRHIFTHDEWGDYLIYKLYPAVKVFVDGRSDFYGSEFLKTYLDVMHVQYDWQEKLDRYQVDTILLPPSAALAGAIKESRRWRVAYDDGISIVFRAQPAASEFSTAGTGFGNHPSLWVRSANHRPGDRNY